MKLPSISLVALLSSFAVAVPFPSQFSITIRMDDVKATQGACWPICGTEELECPEGLHRGKLGGCYTCCTEPESDLATRMKAKENKLQIKSSDQVSVSLRMDDISVMQEGICLAICYFQEMPCYEGWYSKQFGNCWTCCRDPDLDVATQSEFKKNALQIKSSDEVSVPLRMNDISAMRQGICLRICAPVEIPCAKGWSAKQLGGCWTCCRNEGPDVATQKTSKKNQLDHFFSNTL